MPIYEYECSDCKHRFERSQRFSDSPVTECPECGAPVRRILHAAGIVFKGSGWYVTDSRKSTSSESSAAKTDGAESAAKTDGAESAAGRAAEKSETKSDSKSDSKSETKTDSKAQTKSETAAGAKSTTAAASSSAKKD